MSRLAALEEHLAGLGRVLLGYSGGVDSTLLAVAGRRALGPRRFLAVIGRSDSYPAAQYRSAIAVAQRFEVPVLEVGTEELGDPDYLANSTNRCFFCKAELWRRLTQVAGEGGYDVVVDGTNADDLAEHRPGLLAGSEWRVRSPLAELRWTKLDVREAARELGIPIWDAPAAPCLSSRVAYGLRITPERLRQVEAAEAFLRSLGVEGDLRVRHHGDHARLEVAPAHFDTVRSRWGEIEAFFAATGFAHVELDPRGYRRGSLLSVLPLLSG
jgi:pyridinium-3,5-biscarboxylic acid mononucleotide sulfurtransferase